MESRKWQAPRTSSWSFLFMSHDQMEVNYTVKRTRCNQDSIGHTGMNKASWGESLEPHTPTCQMVPLLSHLAQSSSPDQSLPTLAQTTLWCLSSWCSQVSCLCALFHSCEDTGVQAQVGMWALWHATHLDWSPSPGGSQRGQSPPWSQARCSSTHYFQRDLQGLWCWDVGTFWGPRFLSFVKRPLYMTYSSFLLIW